MGVVEHSRLKLIFQSMDLKCFWYSLNASLEIISTYVNDFMEKSKKL